MGKPEKTFRCGRVRVNIFRNDTGMLQLGCGVGYKDAHGQNKFSTYLTPGDLGTAVHLLQKALHWCSSDEANEYRGPSNEEDDGPARQQNDDDIPF